MNGDRCDYDEVHPAGEGIYRQPILLLGEDFQQRMNEKKIQQPAVFHRNVANLTFIYGPT